MYTNIIKMTPTVLLKVVVGTYIYMLIYKTEHYIPSWGLLLPAPVLPLCTTL